jgi:hypothetical protein
MPSVKVTVDVERMMIQMKVSQCQREDSEIVMPGIPAQEAVVVDQLETMRFSLLSCRTTPVKTISVDYSSRVVRL